MQPADSLISRIETCDFDAAGDTMLARVTRLYPLTRSITGDGVRQTLDILAESVDMQRYEIPTGTPVFDWIVPDEWTVREAWIKNPDGSTLVDIKDHNLHLVGYSRPVDAVLSREALLPHLHSLPDQPDWIPYRTSYYADTWGFCLPDRVRSTLPAGNYTVRVEAELTAGNLTYGEVVLPGATDDTFLFSTHICHPSLANDNCSGMAVATQLIRLLDGITRRYTYRFLFIPGTIGSITWLALNTEAARRIRHGLVLSCLGDAGHPHYKRTRQGAAAIDRAMALVLRDHAPGHTLLDFVPYGYDERQYGSPGFNLPVGLLTRSPHGTFPEYHTSADNPEFLQAGALAHSLRILAETVRVIEEDGRFRNTNPMCEPQLGRHGLYDRLGGANDRQEAQLALLWVLNQSDGTHSLSDIATRSTLPWHRIETAAAQLRDCGLLEPVVEGSGTHIKSGKGGSLS